MREQTREHEGRKKRYVSDDSGHREIKGIQKKLIGPKIPLNEVMYGGVW